MTFQKVGVRFIVNGSALTFLNLNANTASPSPAPAPKKPRRRGRSSSRTTLPLDLNIFNNQIDTYFETVAQLDTDDCGKRLVCEIKTDLESSLTEEERLVAGLFPDTWGLDESRAKSIYDAAAYLGSTTKSKAACAKRFFKCPVDRKTILKDLAKQREASILE